jgi:hypothetical protein
MSKHRNRSWTAYGMPQMLAHIESEEAAPRDPNVANSDRGQNNTTEDDRMSAPVQSRTLYWMQKHAVDVAVGLTAHGVPSHTAAELLRSSNIASSGFMCFEKPIGTLRWELGSGENVPWDAVMWNLTSGLPGDRFGQRPMHFHLMSRMDGHKHLLRARDAEYAKYGWDPGIQPPLTGVLTWVLDSDRQLFDDAVHDADYTLALLTSVLLTAGQPRLTSQKVLGPGEGVVIPRVDRGAKAAQPEVVVIDLLRRPPDDASGARMRGKGKDHDHRWWVRGHYKMQPYGPQSALRKTIYVSPHTAGPEDKPLLELPRVNLIRTDPPSPAADEKREGGDGSAPSR